MSRCIVKPMYLEKPKRFIIWNKGSKYHGLNQLGSTRNGSRQVKKDEPKPVGKRYKDFSLERGLRRLFGKTSFM